MSITSDYHEELTFGNWIYAIVVAEDRAVVLRLLPVPAGLLVRRAVRVPAVRVQGQADLRHLRQPHRQQPRAGAEAPVADLRPGRVRDVLDGS